MLTSQLDSPNWTPWGERLGVGDVPCSLSRAKKFGPELAMRENESRFLLARNIHASCTIQGPPGLLRLRMSAGDSFIIANLDDEGRILNRIHDSGLTFSESIESL